jgi:hypothetical protein
MTTTIQETRKTALLDAATTKFGFLPNVLSKMSTSTAALEIYMRGQDSLAHEENHMSDRDRQGARKQ